VSAKLVLIAGLVLALAGCGVEEDRWTARDYVRCKRLMNVAQTRADSALMASQPPRIGVPATCARIIWHTEAR
jgi:hypothetical protein